MKHDKEPVKKTVHLTDQTRPLLNPPPIQWAAYSDRTAWLMGQLSNLAYSEFEASEKSKAHLEKELEGIGFKLVDTFHETILRFSNLTDAERAGLKDGAKTDTQAILVASADKAVLSFRGSEANTTDWLATDADAKFVNVGEDEDGDGRPERVHRGFFESYLAVRDRIEEAIRNHIDDDTPLFVTGHSLGGGLANVAARELEKVRPLAAVYTFGSPRVGNPEWTQTLRVPVYRVVNNRDVVALVPFSGFVGNVLTRMGLGRLIDLIRRKIYGFIGYQHVGDLRFLTKAGEIKLGSDATINRLLAVFFDTFWLIYRRSRKKLFGHAMSFGTDHLMENYNEKLENVALKRNPPTGIEV